ncbi:TPA: hypothetical protein N0F65_012891 [Lagenidium giganteum]|uniref:PH domain-containing protein n=1 Tax=Lagenidium giganteum TaxID=4803 RepID=A0AAV2YQS8_9STRA|nr:TPA: hypothetical protein N0F65_012891 [Lagenidium giganteum]
MEGYLLQFTKEREATLRYGVLTDGMLQLHAQPNSSVLQSIPLTKHRVRVHLLSGWKTCPNRFVVYTLPIERNENNGKCAPKQGAREHMHCFAAVTLEKAELWAKRILNWRRRSFHDSLPTANSGDRYDNEADDGDIEQLGDHWQQQELKDMLFVARRFEIRMVNKQRPSWPNTDRVSFTTMRDTLARVHPVHRAKTALSMLRCVVSSVKEDKRVQVVP